MPRRRRRGKQYIFYIHRSLTDFRLEEMEAFIHHSRSAMNAAWQEFNRDFDAKTAGWDQRAIDCYINGIIDDVAMLRDASPQLLRQTHCIMLYGTFEHALADLCRTVHRDKKITTPLKADLYMSDIKGYLRPHIGKRPVPFAKEWEWLDEFRVIRNWLAHNDGKIRKDNPHRLAVANRFVRRNRGLIHFTHLRDIVIEQGLVDRALQKVRAALDRVFNATQKKLYRD